jgi:glucose/arabinose dehydrogenase
VKLLRSVRLSRGVALFALALTIGCRATAAQESSPPRALSIETFITGLDTPWAIDFAPDGRIFVTERAGRVRVIEQGKLRPDPWLTLEVAATGEAGLMGLAVDPQFAKNRYIYVAHTYRSGAFAMRNRLVRLRDVPKTGQGVVDKILIDHIPGANNHDGGRVRFGPDGKLYWTTGDAQTTSLSQDIKSLAGKILRLNADGSIPADNPFANSYVYSYGHRNPQGLAWQPGSGRLLATEHGPSGFQGCCRDEVNLIEAGKNYGWPLARGDESAPGMVAPLIHAGTSETWAPGGMTFVSQGNWTGSLLFTGLRGQTLYRLQFAPGTADLTGKIERHFYRQYGRLRDIAEGPDKALYLLTSNRDGRGNPAADDDRILRLIPPR